MVLASPSGFLQLVVAVVVVLALSVQSAAAAAAAPGSSCPILHAAAELHSPSQQQQSRHPFLAQSSRPSAALLSGSAVHRKAIRLGSVLTFVSPPLLPIQTARTPGLYQRDVVPGRNAALAPWWSSPSLFGPMDDEKRRRHTHNMISNLFGGGGDAATPPPQLPRDVKEALSSCQAATQAALQNRVSRMDIEFPVGTNFGIEQKGNNKKNTINNKPTLDDFQRSDRELARVFVEMFQPVGGGDRLVVAFGNVEQADAARQAWRDDATASARILSMDRRRSSAAVKQKRKSAASKGFAAKMAMEIEDNVNVGGGDDDDNNAGPFAVPPNAEVVLFVAPGPRELVLIERICEQVGMGTLVILLNARLASMQTAATTTAPLFGTAAAQTLFTKEFESVFLLAATPQETAPGCMLHHVYQKEWILARKPAVGPPKTILVQPQRPSVEDCQAALEGLEVSEVEKNVESAMENMANWFR